MAFEYQGFASLGVNLNRQKYGPLDISNVFTSEADLRYYLTKGAFTEGVSTYWYKDDVNKVVPYPYEGQVLATVIDGVVNVYALALDDEGNFVTQEIAGKVEADGTSIKVNDDGRLELVGLPADTTGKTYVPSLVNGVLTWAEPDTSTAEGQAQEIEGLKTRTTALEATVNGKAESTEGAGDGVVGLVEKVADNTGAIATNAQAISDEETAREAADKAITDSIGEVAEGKTVVGMIADAVAEAKQYADDNDTVYDDTALAGRVKAIEDDYLKTADKYDDTALADRVKAIEDDYLKAEDKYDDTALAGRVGTLETTSADHETRIGKVEDFFKTADGESLSEAMDTLIEIQKEIASDNEGAAAMLADIQANTTAIATLNGDATTAGSVDKKIADAVAPLATTDALNDVKATADAAAVKTEVEGALALKADADKVVANDTFEQFKTDNTDAIATAKQEAIDAAAAAEEAKGYAVASEVATTYATKAELTSHEEEIENELLAYAKTDAVNAELAKKVETATIAHAVAAVEADPENGIEAVEGIPEGVTKEGTTLKIVVDAPTRAETIQLIADKVAQVTGGESAADVKLALEAEVERSTAKDTAHDTALAKLNGEATVAGSVAEAKALAQKGVDDAATVAADLATANTKIADNTAEIGVVDGKITAVNGTLTQKITALEGKDTIIEGDITALQTTVGGHTTTITEQGIAIQALQNRDTELATLIQGNTGKFANYTTTEQLTALLAGKADQATTYTKSEVDALLANLDPTEIEEAIEANATAIATLVGEDTDKSVRAIAKEEVAAIVGTAPEALDTLEEVANWIANDESGAAAMANDIAALKTTVDTGDKTVSKYVEDAIGALTYADFIKASDEVTIAEDGTLGVGQINVNKLVQTEGETLVLNGGNA